MAGKIISEKIKEGRVFRACNLECRKAENEEEQSFIVEGYASTFNDPYLMGENDEIRVLEQVDRNAFDKCDMSDVIFQYDHQGRVFARLSNNTLRVSTDEHGLRIWADLGGTEEGRKLYDEIRKGYTTRMSFCFIVRGDSEEARKAEDGKTEYIRTITDISKLYDVSAVSIPANDGTEISARAYVDGVISEYEKREAERLQEEQDEEEKRQREEKERKERERLALEMSFSL